MWIGKDKGIAARVPTVAVGSSNVGSALRPSPKLPVEICLAHDDGLECVEVS
jgi:hypothetical protein